MTRRLTTTRLAPAVGQGGTYKARLTALVGAMNAVLDPAVVSEVLREAGRREREGR